MADDGQVQRGLKDKLTEAQETGAPLNISAADVASFAPEPATTQGPVQGKVSIKVEPPQDPMLDVGAEGDTSAQIRADQNRIRVADMLAAGEGVKEIDIEADERAAFLDVLVSGERFVLPFSIYGGRIRGKFRSRSQAESDAIISRLAAECRTEDIHSEMEYATRMRHMLLAAQVAELQGEECVPLGAPLKPQRKGEEVEPIGWIDQVASWGGEQDGLVAAVYQQLVQFESKYWTMVKHAGDQDFWPPVESTSV